MKEIIKILNEYKHRVFESQRGDYPIDSNRPSLDYLFLYCELSQVILQRFPLKNDDNSLNSKNIDIHEKILSEELVVDSKRDRETTKEQLISHFTNLIDSFGGKR